MAFPRFLILLLLLPLGACDVPFDAKGEFRNLVAVYGILSDRTDTVFVRLYNSYEPDGFDPLQQTEDLPLHGAVVRLFDGVTTSTLAETTVSRLDTTRYNTPISLYRGQPLPIRKGSTYSLTIETADGRSSIASQTTPSRGIIGIANPSVLANPGLGANVLISAVLSTSTQGYRVRFYMHFDVFQGGQWVSYDREIPRQVEGINTPLKQLHYHELSRRTTEGGESQEVVSFLNDAYRQGLEAIRTEFIGLQVRWIRAVFVLAQVDLHLYNYYNTAHAFRDPYSIRVDQSDHTNVQGGVGVFGSIVHDSTVYSFPPGTEF